MNQTMSTGKKNAQQTLNRSSASGKATSKFTVEERAAMKERAKELKAQMDEAEAEKAVLAKIAELAEPERSMCGRLHAIIKSTAPMLSPKVWYGMPAYYKDGKVMCYFQSAQKFNTRYATIGFSDKANLDEGDIWPVVYALNKLTATEEAKIVALLKKAIG